MVNAGCVPHFFSSHWLELQKEAEPFPLRYHSILRLFLVNHRHSNLPRTSSLGVPSFLRPSPGQAQASRQARRTLTGTQDRAHCASRLVAGLPHDHLYNRFSRRPGQQGTDRAHNTDRPCHAPVLPPTGPCHRSVLPPEPYEVCPDHTGIPAYQSMTEGPPRDMMNARSRRSFLASNLSCHDITGFTSPLVNRSCSISLELQEMPTSPLRVMSS